MRFGSIEKCEVDDTSVSDFVLGRGIFTIISRLGDQKRPSVAWSCSTPRFGDCVLSAYEYNEGFMLWRVSSSLAYGFTDIILSASTV